MDEPSRVVRTMANLQRRLGLDPWALALTYHDCHQVSVLELAQVCGVEPGVMVEHLRTQREEVSTDGQPEGETHMPHLLTETRQAAIRAADHSDPFQTMDQPKGKRREYLLLKELPDGRFEPLAWHEDSAGYVVAADAPGAVPKTSAKAVNAEAALAVGFAATGEPAEGVRLVAVAALHFQAKTVRPKPVERRQPSPARLKFE